MTTTLSDIRFAVQEEIEDQISNEKVIQGCNIAQAEFMLRIFIPGSTTQAITTTALTYTLSPTTIRQIRRLRLQSDVDDKINRAYNPVYTFYNGVFEVPTPFGAADTLLIDYYAYLKTFTAISDTIDLADRFKPLYTSYIKAMYYSLPSTRASIGENAADMNYQREYNIHLSIKKQVSDFYITAIGIQKPAESGW